MHFCTNFQIMLLATKKSENSLKRFTKKLNDLQIDAKKSNFCCVILFWNLKFWIEVSMWQSVAARNFLNNFFNLIIKLANNWNKINALACVSLLVKKRKKVTWSILNAILRTTYEMKETRFKERWFSIFLDIERQMGEDQMSIL